MPEIPEIANMAINTAGTVAGVGETARLATDTLAGRGPIARLFRRGAKATANNPTPKLHPFEPRKLAPVETTGPVVTVAHHEFQKGFAGLPAITPDARGRMEGKSPPETHELSKEVVDGIRGITTGYVQGLIDMTNDRLSVPGKTAYEAMKEEQRDAGLSYAEDDFLLEQFTTLNPQTGIRTLKTAEEINTLIKTYHRKLMMIAEEWAQDALAAGGFRAEIKDWGHRSNLNNLPRTISLTDQGPGRKVGNAIMGFLRSPLNPEGRGDPGISKGTAIRRLALIGGALGAVEGPAGIAAGAALGPTVAAGIQRLFAHGVRLDIVEDESVLRQAQTTGERRRAINLIGINPNNQEQSTRYDSAIQEAIRIIYLRAEYFEAFGVNPKQLDALSDQILYLPRGRRPEEIGDKMLGDIQRIFNQRVNDATIAAGRATTLEERREILRKTRQDVLIQDFEQEIRSGTKITVDEAKRLRDAIAAMGEGGTYAQERTKEAGEEQQRLQAERTSLETSDGAIKIYRDKVAEIQRERTKLQRTLAGTRTPTATYTTVERATDAMRTVLIDPGFGDITIVLEDGRTPPIANIAAREDAAGRRRDDVYDAVSLWTRDPARESVNQFDARQTKAREKADLQYEREMAPIRRDRTQLESAITRLEDLENNIKNLEEQTLSAAEVTTGAQEITKLSSAETELIGWGVSQVTIDSGDYSAILTEIHNVNAANPANGWPAAQDNLPQNREMLRQAIVRARTNSLRRAGVPNAVVVEPTYTSAINLGFTPEQLRIFSIDELKRQSARLNPAGTPTPRAELQNAQLWAREELRYLQDAIKEQSAVIQNAERIAQRAQIIDVSARLAQFKMVLEMYEHKDQAQARAVQAYTNPQQRANLENIRPAVAGREGYSAAEVATGLPRNILELIHVITDYQNTPDRNGSFQQIWRNLGSTPDLFLRILNDSFRGRLVRIRPGAVPPPVPVNVFAIKLRDTMRANTLNLVNFRESANSMVDELSTWTKSI